MPPTILLKSGEKKAIPDPLLTTQNDHSDPSSGSSDGEYEDSSDDEQPAKTFDITQLPKPTPKPSNPKSTPAVVYIGRLPHGFYEPQLRSYFSQFGDISRLRLSRNKKTGKSKHYAFLEFTSQEVAQIVVETMHNYLITGHLLQCKLVPSSENNGNHHPNLWVGANRKYRTVPRHRKTRIQHNRPRSIESQEKANKRLQNRHLQQQQKIANLGINYSLDSSCMYV